jgi:hypothetical protein
VSRTSSSWKGSTTSAPRFKIQHRRPKTSLRGISKSSFYGAAYYSEVGEQKRLAVNKWIRTGHAYDGVVDFDKATTEKPLSGFSGRLRKRAIEKKEQARFKPVACIRVDDQMRAEFRERLSITIEGLDRR